VSLVVEWVGHACFRVWADRSPVLVLDPYTPDEIGVPEIELEGDIVVLSSLDDRGHCNHGLVRGDPLVVDALAVAQGREAPPAGIPFVAVATHESEEHPDGPDPNAMYAFELGGLWVHHLGDVGHALEAAALAPFVGRCDVLLAPTGEGFTISLADLDAAIDRLAPRWIIPMHYGLPALSVDMVPVENFLARRELDHTLWAHRPTVEIPDTAPDGERPTVIVLEPSGF
jgi:L-ascorbate metabolism protein UlaG (beta-lactamase superfamily)